MPFSWPHPNCARFLHREFHRTFTVLSPYSYRTFGSPETGYTAFYMRTQRYSNCRSLVHANAFLLCASKYASVLNINVALLGLPRPFAAVDSTAAAEAPRSAFCSSSSQGPPGNLAMHRGGRRRARNVAAGEVALG